MSRGLPAPVTEIWDWQLRGACRGLDGGVFFPPDHERGPARAAREQRARQLCRTCPVMDPRAIADEFISQIGNASRSGGSVPRSRDRLRGRWLFVEHHLEVGEELVGAKPGISRTVAAVARLINILTARGEDLKAGSVALSGGLVSPVPVRPWGVVSAEFDGLGTIEVYA